MANMVPGFNKKLNPKGRWITADLHIHSIYSDGGFSPARILKYATVHFLEAIAIADHSEIKGAIEGRTLAEKDPGMPLVLAAQEVSAGNRFHFLLINSSAPQPEFTKENIIDLLTNHRRLGGVTVVAHPWTMPNTKWARSCLKELITADLIDGIELFNSAALEISEVRDVWQRIWEEWIGPYQLAVLGGSDFHHLYKGRYIGSGRTYLKVYSRSVQGVLDALRARRCVAGLFGHQNDEEEGLLWGQDPWSAELQRFRENLQKKLVDCYLPDYQRFFSALYKGGHYQYLADLL